MEDQRIKKYALNEVVRLYSLPHFSYGTARMVNGFLAEMSHKVPCPTSMINGTISLTLNTMKYSSLSIFKNIQGLKARVLNLVPFYWSDAPNA